MKKVLGALVAVIVAAILGLAVFSVIAQRQLERDQNTGASADGLDRRARAAAARVAREQAARQAQEAELRKRREAAKEDALQYVRVSRTACRELTEKTEAVNWNSTLNLTELNRFIPAELYPTDAFATYVGEQTFAEVRSQLSQLVDLLVDMLRPLSRNSLPTAEDALQRPPEQAVAERAAFQEKKLKALTAADAFCESVRRAGVGLPR